MAEAAQRRAEVPKYRLTEKCYLNERFYDPDEMKVDETAEPLDDGTLPKKPLIVAFAGTPAYYMEPMNDAARAQCEKYRHLMRATDPINELHIVTPAAQPATA